MVSLSHHKTRARAPAARPHDLSRVKLRHLHVLLAIEENRSLRGAAERLHVSEPAVSSSLRELETIVGQPVFERRGRIIRTTAHGATLIRHAQAVVAELRAANDALAALDQGGQGRLSIGTLLAAETDLVPSALSLLRMEAPELMLSVRCGELNDLLGGLREGALDIVIGRLERVDGVGAEEFEQKLLYTDPMVVVAASSHPLARRGRIGLEALAQATWVLPVRGTWRRERIDDAFRALSLESPSHIECESLLASLTLVEQGTVLGVLPKRFAEQLASQKRLAVLPVALNTAFGPVGAIWRKGGQLSPHAERFLQLLQDAVRYDEANPG